MIEEKRYNKLFTICLLQLKPVWEAKCYIETITFFGVLQKLYALFNPVNRWAIMKDVIGKALQSQSGTWWSACLKSVCPFAKHLSELLSAL